MIYRLIALSLGLTLAVALCRFTVRDVGFVDLGDPGYQYYTFVSDAGSPGVADASRRIAEAVFAETNIEFEVIDPEGDDGHAAHRHIRELNIERFPTTVLVHPDGHAVELPIEGDFAKVGATVFASVADSKLRQRITESVLRHYCVVLLVECDDVKRNQDAERAVRASFKAIEKVFDRMPKDVGALPELMTLVPAGQADEKVLLWSLGIDPQGEGPFVALLTGRGRLFGSVLEGTGITADSVLDILGKAGESCECGLDRSWMRGLRIPLRWDADTRQLAVDLLGFDPENPIVKSEISSILAKGVSGLATKGAAPPTVADLLLGYSEEGVADDLGGDPGDDPGDDPIEDGVVPDVIPSAGDEVNESAVSGLALWITFGALALASLGAAVFVFVRVGRS